MKDFCNYHPTRIAHWSCPKCSAMLCPECVIKRDKGPYTKGEYLHLCPKCNISVDWVGVENIIDPFWHRMPKIFTYPLSPSPLILMIVLSVVTVFFSGSGIFSLLLRGIAWLIVLKYSFESLKTTASGDLKPPKINSETISTDFQQVFKQYGIFILIFLFFGWIAVTVGPFLGIAFMLFALLFVPAMIILLVTTNSLFHAVNPVLFVQLAFRIGRGYLLMYFFLLLLGAAPAVVMKYIIKFFPAGLHLLLYGLAQSYYMIVSYHLMGYVILQYHEEVGYEVDFDDFRDPSLETVEPEKIDPDAVILKEVNPMIQDGKLDEAISAIKDMTRKDGITSVDLSDRYYKLLKMKKRTSEMLEHGINHLDLLAADNNKPKAVKVYTECRKIDPKFLPSPVFLLKLAGWLNEAGKTKEAVGIYNSIVKAYPENQLAPKAYFRAAQIIHDRLMNPEKARKILNSLISKYPDNEIVPHVKNYIANM